MEEETPNKYGTIVVGVGDEQRTLQIKDFVTAEFSDRLIHISTIEDGSICAQVNNPEGVERAASASIWLSKESFLGLVSTAMIYFGAKEMDFEKELNEAIGHEKYVSYQYSDNLKNAFKK